MASYYWIKLWIDVLSDPKMGPLPDRLWRRAIELFLAARTGEGDGFLPDLETVAWMLHLSLDELREDLGELQKTGIVGYHEKGWHVTNFAKRQERVSNAERKRRWRQRSGYEERGGNGAGTTRSLEAEAEDRGTEVQKTDVEAEADQPPAAGTPIRDTMLVYNRLRELGVEDPVRTELTGSAWVTCEYINQWWTYVQSWKDATDAVKLKSMICRMLERRQAPPEKEG
jgi:hypothetical protein